MKLYDQFIKDSKTGKRLQKNGTRIKLSSIGNYEFLRKLLADFSVKKQFNLRIRQITRFKKEELEIEKRYWMQFYKTFTAYLYDDCDCYDNFVGSNIKKLRTFFNYLKSERDLNIGTFYKLFYVYNEEIETVSLTPEQLNFLIYNKVFEDSLPVHLVKTKDMFVFGCTVALRVSDILNLTWNNIEKINGESYLKIISQKTQTFTKIILPDYAVIILKKYTDNQERIFPKITNSRLNKNIKSLIELTNWTETRIKTRQKRGMPIHVLKNNEKYRFCDHITSHTMRRTAITNLLCLGVPENVVRKISGHTANSKEFFKYVELSQKFIDTESEKAWDHLK